MMEFVLRRSDAEGEWFSLNSRDFAKVLQPKTLIAQTMTDSVGRHVLRFGDAEFTFVHEHPGIQVTVKGAIAEAVAMQFLQEVLESIKAHTGESGRIMDF